MERDFFEAKRLSPEERRAAGKALRDMVPGKATVNGKNSSTVLQPRAAHRRPAGACW